MDNSNNNNSSNPTYPPIPDTGFNPQTPNPIPPSPSDPSANLQPPTTNPSSPWDSNPSQVEPSFPQTPAPTSPTQPYPPFPPTPTPTTDANLSQNQTFTPPVNASFFSQNYNPQQPTADIPTPYAPPQPTQNETSPLDNPWGSPTQPPPIDDPNQIETPQIPDINSTFIPPPQSQQQAENPVNLGPSTSSWYQQSSPTPEANPIEGEPAPTDLTHLLNSNNQPENIQAPVNEAETLVAPANEGMAEVPTVPTEESKHFPKWLIGVGLGLLIIVAGASAYFILGIGRSEDTTSIPAETVPSQTQEVKPPAPITTPPAQAETTESSNFGELQGSGTQQATSAADLLRQRQQQGQ